MEPRVGFSTSESSEVDHTDPRYTISNSQLLRHNRRSQAKAMKSMSSTKLPPLEMPQLRVNMSEFNLSSDTE